MAFFENPQRFCIFVKTILIVMLKDGKQERTVVHLELNGSHFYYGNLKALCDNWGKNDIGISYNYLKNYGISETKTLCRKEMNNKERYDCDLTSTKGKRQVVLAEYTVLASSVRLLSTKDSLYMKTLSEISDQIADLEPQRYKIYKTENMYNLIKLDTATGRIWQVQYGMNNYAKPMETPIDDRSLLMSSEKVCSVDLNYTRQIICTHSFYLIRCGVVYGKFNGVQIQSNDLGLLLHTDYAVSKIILIHLRF